MKKTSIALLFLALSLQASADVHLLPAGEFVGRDGRPGKGLTWKLSNPQGQALAARLNARHASVQFNLDYEHQAMLAESNGRPAPASGWAQTFEWRNDQGLFALAVQWTANAQQMIEAGEYKYISPVIAFDKATGEVVDVMNAALVNIPNLDLNPVAQERVARLNASFNTPFQPPEKTMNPVLLACLTALGLPQTEAVTAEQATTAIAALKAQADTATTLTTEVAALKAATPDAAKYVSLDKFTALSTELAALTAKQAGDEVDALITQARLDGKCIPAVEAVWRDVGKANLAQLKSLVAAAPANPALAGHTQTGGKAPAADANAPGTVDELAMCKNMGLTLEEFRKGAEA
jgi:phage I-like protein